MYPRRRYDRYSLSSSEEPQPHPPNRRRQRRRSLERRRPEFGPRRPPQEDHERRRTISLTFTDEDGTEYSITIPSPNMCNRRPRQQPNTVYCGDKPDLPPGYTRRGTQHECLKKGFGAGRCSIYDR